MFLRGLGLAFGLRYGCRLRHRTKVVFDSIVLGFPLIRNTFLTFIEFQAMSVLTLLRCFALADEAPRFRHLILINLFLLDKVGVGVSGPVLRSIDGSRLLFGHRVSRFLLRLAKIVLFVFRKIGGAALPH